MKEMILFSFDMWDNSEYHIEITNYEPAEEQRSDCPASGPVVEFNAYFKCSKSEYDIEKGIYTVTKLIPVPEEMYDYIAESVIEQAIENY